MTHVKKDQSFALILGIIVFTMLCLAYASVPIYKIFCQKTGYGGTTQVADYIPDVNLPWQFIPSQHEVQLKIGEVGLAFYEAKNTQSYPITGMATYNVTPDRAGLYFHKVHCFCFEEQTLEPGEQVKMPLQFFIDPKIADDPQLKDVKTINLSYTFFIIRKGH